MDNVFTVGEIVPYSGVYRITHYPSHNGRRNLYAHKRKHISAVRPLLARILHADQAGVLLRR